MCVGISSDIRVEFTVSCGKLKRPESIPSFSFTFDQKDVCWTIGVLYASMMSFGSTFRFMTVLIWMGKGSQ